MATPDLGYLGSVYIGANKVAEITQWDGTFEAGQEEWGSFGDAFRKRKYTVKDASGSFSGNSDKADTTGQNALISQFLNGGTPAAVFLYLYISGAVGYYGEALVAVTKNVDTTGLQPISASWVAANEWFQNVG